MTFNFSPHYPIFVQRLKVNKGFERTKVWALSLAGHSFGPLLVLELRVLAVSASHTGKHAGLNLYTMYPPVIKHGLLECEPIFNDFPDKISIYIVFSCIFQPAKPAMFDYSIEYMIKVICVHIWGDPAKRSAKRSSATMQCGVRIRKVAYSYKKKADIWWIDRDKRPATRRHVMEIVSCSTRNLAISKSFTP